MPRNCTCTGTNPNCYRCYGTGILSNISIEDQSKSDRLLVATLLSKTKKPAQNQ